MKKPASLRAAIAAAVPDLAKNPDKFLVYVDAGSVVARKTKTMSFDYRYTLNLVLLDYAGDSDTVIIAALEWVAANQPELLAVDDKRQKGIEFIVDHLNNATCDLAINLDLTESVLVQTDGAGARTVTHLEEPVPDWEREGLA